LERKYWDTESAKPNWLQLEPIPAIAGWTPESSLGRAEWNIKIAGSVSDTERIMQEVKRDMEDTTVWTSSSKIGGKVAGKTRDQAMAAVFLSLLGIVGYVWFRFQKLAYGLAAVVALIHDVLITIGFIAVSAWLAGIFGFLLIEEFKISLTVIAAILTLIGYSLNDTIVTFDRIREVKGKSPQLTAEIVNLSINQTLSRTFLTAGTTLIVVLILYAMGGAGIHGFAFCMLVGVIAGTYSSVFIAAPLLLWMANRTSAPAQPPSRKPSKVA
jgi:SecD/SecF fusion protein